VQPHLPTIGELCPLCFATSYQHPGGVWQCSQCALVFTTRRKALEPESSTRDNLPGKDKAPEPSCDESEALCNSVVTHRYLTPGESCVPRARSPRQ
jgi:hypothetical protein